MAVRKHSFFLCRVHLARGRAIYRYNCRSGFALQILYRLFFFSLCFDT